MSVAVEKVDPSPGVELWTAPNKLQCVANPSFAPQTVSAEAQTIQVAPTMLQALGLDPASLDAVKIERTLVLPEVATQLAK
ncbi:MAG: hypothetical protein WAJ99_11285 [Candidatus Sulfotelmatobacter sp.]